MTGAPYELIWYGCDLLTGGIIEDLRALKPTGALSRRFGDFTTTAFDLPLDGAPLGWEATTAPGRALLVGVDPVIDQPIWAGVVLLREGGSATALQLNTATLERYLDSRHTGDQNHVQQDQAAVAAALVTAAMDDGPPLVLDTVATGTVMDYRLLDADDRTVLSALQEIADMDGGPEWTIDVAWADAGRTGFAFPVRVRPSRGLGWQSDTPEGTFDHPGCVAAYSLSESFEAGKGANVVIARGEGEGSSRLTSSTHIAPELAAGGWPRWEYRYTPATGITNPDQLNAHAAQTLADITTGTRVWTLEAVASQAPRIGRDWNLGDSVRIAVETSPRHPDGADVVARCWSWELDPGADRVRPILIEED